MIIKNGHLVVEISINKDKSYSMYKALFYKKKFNIRTAPVVPNSFLVSENPSKLYDYPINSSPTDETDFISPPFRTTS